MAALGWAVVAWVVAQASVEDPRARLAFVAALAVGLYASATLFAYAVGSALWPRVPRPIMRAFGEWQGLAWSGLLTTLALLRLSGELSVATALIFVGAFVGAQWIRLGWRP